MSHPQRLSSPGLVTSYGPVGGNSHLADIEKLSNGYVVRFFKAERIQVKARTMEDFGFTGEVSEMVRYGLEQIKDLKESEKWKDLSDDVRQAVGEAGKPKEMWTTRPMAVACKNEDELLEAIRQAVTSHHEIEKLTLAGEFTAY